MNICFFFFKYFFRFGRLAKLNWRCLILAVLFSSFVLTAYDRLDGKQVSYNTFGIRKTIFVPKVPARAVIEDFDIFRPGQNAASTKEPMRSKVEISRDASHLFLHIIAEEPLKIRDNNKENHLNLHKGDLFEIFFGGIQPEPWCMQFIVGAGGGRFSDALPLDAWQGRAVVLPNSYELFVTIPLKALKVYNSGIGFNICRQRSNEQSIWSKVAYGFHEVENFGELLLDDYEKVYENRFSASGKGINTREKFEQAAFKKSVSAVELRGIPRLLYPEKDKMTVSWESCGRTFGVTEFRRKGTQKFCRVVSLVNNGVPAPASVHRTVLDDLKPDTVYEYRVLNYHPVLKTEIKSVSKLFTFRTLPVAQKDFTCVFFCDIHGSFEKLDKLMQHPLIKNADLVFDLGDMHSMLTGLDAVQRGYLDVQTKHLAGSKPLVFVRGNHEIRGISNGLFDTFLGHPSGNSHFLMRYGDVSFMVIDTGDPKFDVFGTGKIYRNMQKKWIVENLRNPYFADSSFKILLGHIPPTYNKKIRQWLSGCFDFSQPDLMLSGHVHKIQFFKKGEKQPFPIGIGYGALVLKSTSRNVELVFINWNGEVVRKETFLKRCPNK